MTPKPECAGKVALVTGASRGIGAAIAERLAAAGAHVALGARSLDRAPDGLPGTLRDVVARIEARGGRAVAVRADVSDATARKMLVDACEQELGPIDILINNVAYGPYKPFLDFTDRDFERTCELNLRCAFHLCQLVLPGMCERKRGWIVNISSATARHPAGPDYIAWDRVGGHHLYGATKAALDRLTTGLAAEFSEHRVAINSLAPVAAVITPGVEAKGIAEFIEPSMVEPVEAMAEAALALSVCDSSIWTGRVAYSVELLAELGREVRALDGSER